jgi:hypothetical protein
MVMVHHEAAARTGARPAVSQTLPPQASAGDFLANELFDPTNGELVDLTDPDSIIDSYARMKAMSDKLWACITRLRQAAADLTIGDKKTRRIAGKRRAAKVELPAESFEQSVLKELWNSHPEIAQEYLRIESLGVKAKEYKKLLDTSAPTRPDLEFFRDAISKASRGRAGLPTLTVEK